MKTHSTKLPIVTTSVLCVALLANTGCQTIQKAISHVTDSGSLTSLVVGTTTFFGAKSVFRTSDGKAALIATIAGVATQFIIKAAANGEKDRVAARGKEIKNQMERPPQPVSTAPNPSRASSPRYGAIEVPSAPSTSQGQPVTEPEKSRFMVYDFEKDEIVGDEVYEAASRPRNEEKITVGDKELVYVRSGASGETTPN